MARIISRGFLILKIRVICDIHPGVYQLQAGIGLFIDHGTWRCDWGNLAYYRRKMYGFISVTLRGKKLPGLTVDGSLKMGIGLATSRIWWRNR